MSGESGQSARLKSRAWLWSLAAGSRSRMTLVVLASALSVWVFAISSDAVQADQAADDYAAAVGFYKQNRWGFAEEAFKKFLKEHPRHERVPFARLYLGLVLTNQEKYQESRAVLEAFVKDYPKNQQIPQAMYRIAEASYFLDDLKRAEADFTAFLAKSPEDPLREYALPYLADTQLRLGKAEPAATNFAAAIKLFPEGKLLEDSRWGLAKALEAQQKFSEATEIYRQLAANPAGSRAAQAQLQIASRLFEQREFAQAAAEYVKLVKTFPESKYAPTAHLNAGYAYYELRDFKSAAAQFELAAKDEQQAPLGSYWHGMTQKQLGDLAAAEAIFKAAYEKYGDQSIAEQILFQWADCELRLSKVDAAEQHFAEVAKRWPEGMWADDSLYFAGEAALQRAHRATDEATRLAAIDAADGYTKQFTTSQPNSGLKLYNELLRGRVLLARGSDADAVAASELLKSVLAAAQRPQTQAQARYHLARAQQRLKQHAAVLETLGPLVEQVRAEGAKSEFVDGLVLYASSLLMEKKYAEAKMAAADYVRLVPQGNQLDQALAALALAQAQLKDFDAAKQSVEQLRIAAPKSSLPHSTALQLAEVAYAQKEFEVAQQWYAMVIAAGSESNLFVPALSGQSWSQFELKQYKAAAAGFAKIVQDFPQHALAAEAGFKWGESLLLDDQLEEAAKAFTTAFAKFSPGKYGYLCGLEAARTYRRLKNIEGADAAYKQLLEKFPKPDNLDKLLNEWAQANYDAERYARSDEIFQRLVSEFPDSEVADDARFFLAESDLDAGKVDEAKKVFQQLEQNPKSDADVQQRSLFQLMAIAEVQQRWDELAAISEKSRSRFPEGLYRSDSDFFLALSHLQRHKAEPALELLKPLAAAKADPAMKQKEWFPRVFVLLAEGYWQQKKYPEAMAAIAELREWDAKSRFLYQANEVLGRVYKMQAKFHEARSAFQAVLDDPLAERTETAAKAHFMIAETYILQENYKAALENFLKVYILYKFPDWQAPALFQAAGCDEKLGQWNKAIEDYELLLKEFPNSEWATKAKPLLEKARQNVKK